MNIAGFNFKPLVSVLDSGNPIIILYKHLATGKYYSVSTVKPRKGVALSALPRVFRDFLNKEPSDYQVWYCEIPGADSIDLKRQVSKVNEFLHNCSKLISRRVVRVRMYEDIPLEPLRKNLFNICTATQLSTGAHYVFVTQQENDPTATFSAKLKTHNGYVQKQIRHTNRTMHEYAKLHKPLNIDHWNVERDDAEYDNEEMATRIAIKVSRDLMLQGKLVLNRLSGQDPHYYHNQILKLGSLPLESYIRK